MSFWRARLKWVVLGLLFIILVSCGTKPTTSTPTQLAVSPRFTLPAETAAPATQQAATTLAGTPAQTAAATNTSHPTFTPLPYGWKDAPILPEISPHVLEIFREGQKQGRDPHKFSVIGDCQAVPVVFMGPYELGELKPPSDQQYLWDMIRTFKGSYARWGNAVRGGFTAASILTPMQADPQQCKSGETPLTCEFRVQNPAYVFITLETWLDPKTVDRYDGYLRKIMDYVVAHGAVPILMTKADSVEARNGTHVFNPIIIQVAHDYDVPVINFWRAAQRLDNGGIDRNREGFHLSQAGYDLKNNLALTTLYNVWTLENSGETALNGNNATPTTTPTPAAVAGPVVSVPDCAGGCVFYGSAGSQDGVVTFQGVHAFNYSSKKLTRVLGEGYNLQDVSPDGERLLANQGADLYEVSLTDATAKLVSSSFYSLGKQGAYYKSDGSSIVFLDRDKPIPAGNGTAVDLYPSPLDDQLVFDGGSCTSQDFCQSAGVFRQGSNGTVTPMEGILRPVFSPDGKGMAFLNPAAATSENWYHINYVLWQNPQVGIGSQRVFYLPDKHKWLQYPDVRALAFSPDSKKLFILDDIYYEYTENSLRIETYMVDLTTGILYDFGKLTGTSGSFKPHLAWSPQGDKVLFFLTSLTAENKYSLSIYQTDLVTGERLAPYQPDVMVSEGYFYLTNLFWR